jgi:DNA topoisomerase-6 subunit B
MDGEPMPTTPATASASGGQLALGFNMSAARKTSKPKRTKTTKSSQARATSRSRPSAGAKRGQSAEALAAGQRDISVSEFFAKNRHLLGFDNKRKALLTSVKEAVDNGLDACEEGGILPDIDVVIEQTDEDRFRVRVTDNGPGIVKGQIPNIFGKLLYGSKFHRLKMSRGQQGIGISAAGMYGLITTGKPIRIISRTGDNRPAHHYEVAIDTRKNRPEVILDEETETPFAHGTMVEIELVASYSKGRQSVDEYMEQTAIANPHAHFTFQPPGGERRDYPRAVHELPEETREIKPHPYGIELGTMMKMIKDTRCTQLGAFLQNEFCRVTPRISKQVSAKAGLTARTWLKQIGPREIERVYRALQQVKLMAPPTNCLAPIGAEAILNVLLKEIKAEFYTASTRPPAVYRGNPFQIEVGIAYGGELGGDLRDGNGNGKGEPVMARVIRFANRVPLLYQQSSCCTFKAVTETKWNNYGLSQSRGALPAAPMVILVHMASVWVPFTSESKEAIADYDEIRREIKLAVAECGRRLGTLLRRKRKRAVYSQRRDVFTRYINEVVSSCAVIARINQESFRKSLLELAAKTTEQADLEFDEHGKIIKSRGKGIDFDLADTIVVEENSSPPVPTDLFGTATDKPRKRTALGRNTRKRAKTPKRKR